MTAAEWPTRWQPTAVHRAILAGATRLRPAARAEQDDYLKLLECDAGHVQNSNHARASPNARLAHWHRAATARFVLVFRPADALMDKLIANFSVSAP
jgi:hypothetical protein